MRIAICDVGLGNLRSVERALARASGGSAHVEIVRTSDPDVVRSADKVVMPGQGGFGDCAQALDRGLGEVLREQIARGVPYLGICLGLQVLFESSEEAPSARGLGVFAGRVVRLKGGQDPLTGAALKIPHIGWNSVTPQGSAGTLSASPEFFYFVHSYVVEPDDLGLVAGTTEYGARFVSAIAKDNLFACQFHPEKSQVGGLRLLERFTRQ